MISLFKNLLRWFDKKPCFKELGITVKKRKSLYVFLIPSTTERDFENFIVNTMGASDKYKIIFSREGQFRKMIALNMPIFVLISYTNNLEIIPPNLYHTADDIIHFSRLEGENFTFRRVWNVANRHIGIANSTGNTGNIKVA